MIKIVVFLTFVLFCLTALSGAVSAKETIDLQRYVSCSLTRCSLAVDINELTLSVEAKTFLKNARQEDLASALSGLPPSLSSFTYYIQDKEKLIVTADVLPGSDNYWFMEFSNFILDPWFNSSYMYAMNTTLLNTAGLATTANINLTFNATPLIPQYLDAGCVGLAFAYDNGTIIPYDREGCNGVIQIYMNPEIASDNSTIIWAYMSNNTSSLGKNASAFGGYDLVYTFLEGTGTATDDRVGANDGAYQNGQGWANGFFGNATACDGDDSYAITSATLGNSKTQYQIEGWIYITNTSGSNPGVWSKGVYPGDYRQWIFLAYTNNLRYREINASNEYFAWYGGTYVNGWHYVVNRWNGTYMDMFFDGALANSTGLANPSQFVQEASICRHKGGTEDNVGGYVDSWKYTETVRSNAQIRLSYDYATISGLATWGDIVQNGTAPPPAPPAAEPINYTYTVNIDLNNAPAICIDDTTRYRYTTINGASINESYACPHGCDNITMDCAPAQYESDIYNFLVILAVITGIGLIYRYAKK